MVTIVVAAILLAIAVPSFQQLVLSNRLTTVANALVDQANSARLNAIKLNAPTQFCGNTGAANTNDTLGTACGTAAGAVYALPTGAAAANEIRSAVPGITAPIQIANGGVAAVRFSSVGFGYAPVSTPNTPYTGTLAVICTPQLTSNNRREITMSGGSILTTATTTGACP